mmetsp:Transcript_41033/g.128613  ORF Transcript_41033/g.128613 Transcript_41033/m.128613 type:complete len:298 (+) Transcript_41033:129-1022(+)
MPRYSRSVLSASLSFPRSAASAMFRRNSVTPRSCLAFTAALYCSLETKTRPGCGLNSQFRTWPWASRAQNSRQKAQNLAPQPTRPPAATAASACATAQVSAAQASNASAPVPIACPHPGHFVVSTSSWTRRTSRCKSDACRSSSSSRSHFRCSSRRTRSAARSWSARRCVAAASPARCFATSFFSKKQPHSPTPPSAVARHGMQNSSPDSCTTTKAPANMVRSHRGSALNSRQATLKRSSSRPGMPEASSALAHRRIHRVRSSPSTATSTQRRLRLGFLASEDTRLPKHSSHVKCDS